MSVEIMGQATNCACGAVLDDINNFVNSEMLDVCRDCFQIEIAEDEENE